MTGRPAAVDVALVGGGGAAHCLLHALATAGVPVSVAVLDPVSHHGNDRTWCFWDGGTSPVEPAVSRRWRALRVVGPEGDAHELAPVSYAMVRSADLYHHVRDLLAAPRGGADAPAVGYRDPLSRPGGRPVRPGGGPAVRWVPAAVREIRPAGETVRVVTDAGELTARWVFDSRPRRPDRPGGTALLQHFRGRWLTGGRFDPGAATLMDFTAPQPASGLAFGYVLPVGERRALVEYTVFSRSRLPSTVYDAALDRLCDRLGASAATVESTEDGAIPMTDGGFARRVAPRVYRLGTAGGATRPATGYTFATMLRQAAVVAARLAAGAEPVPPRPYPARHLRYDAILLRAVDRGLVDGPRLFTDLLTRHPPARILGFLDGTSTRRDEARILASTPIPAMVRATTGWLATRAARP